VRPPIPVGQSSKSLDCDRPAFLPSRRKTTSSFFLTKRFLLSRRQKSDRRVEVRPLEQSKVVSSLDASLSVVPRGAAQDGSPVRA